jgi:hypothetical protein
VDGRTQGIVIADSPLKPEFIGQTVVKDIIKRSYVENQGLRQYSSILLNAY